MKKIKPEFGNQAQIDMLKREQWQKERDEELLKRAKVETPVGTTTIIACAECEDWTGNAESVREKGVDYRFCRNCDSYIDKE